MWRATNSEVRAKFWETLVKNWQDEFEKWVNCRAKTKAERIECMALADTTRKTVEGMIDQFLSPANYYDVLVVSYETFRMQVERFARKKDSADLIICDEAHRLKNQDAQTSQALASRQRCELGGVGGCCHKCQFGREDRRDRGQDGPDGGPT